MIDASEALMRFLHHWRGTREAPGLWHSFVAGHFDPALIRSECLRLIISRGTARESINSLIEDSALVAAEALIQDECLQDTGLDVKDLEVRLERHRVLSEGEVLASIDGLSRRLSSLGVHEPTYRQQFAEARSWATRDLAQALSILAEVRRSIETLEIAAADGILEAARAHPGQTGEWLEAINRACLDRNIGLAKALIERRPDGYQPVLQPVTTATPKAFARISADQLQLLEWIVTGTGGSPEFYSSWDPITRDNRPLAGAIGAAHALFCQQTDLQVSAHAFVMALADLLSPTSPRPGITSCDGGFASTLSGLDSPYAPAFGDGVVPLLIELPKTKIALPVDAERWNLVFTTEKSAARKRGLLAFDVADLLLCGSESSSFRTNFLRRLLEQIPASDVIPPTAHASTGWMLASRSALLQPERGAPFLVYEGPVGVGKTALLSACATDHDTGWTVVIGLEPATRNRLEADAASAPGGELRPTIILIDNGDRLSTADLSLLGNAVAGRPDSLRVIVTARPGLARRPLAAALTPPVFKQVPLVAFESLVLMATTLVDLSGYRVAGRSVVDRMAFYAHGRPALLFELLRAVYIELGDCGIPRSGMIGSLQVENAMCSSAFHHARRAVLLDPVEKSAETGLVMCAALICFRVYETPEVPLEDVHDWLASEGLAISRDGVFAEMRTIHAMGLFELNESAGTVALSIYGGGGELASLIGDLGSRFAQMKRRMIG